MIAETTTTYKLVGYVAAIGVFEYLSIEETQVAILSALMVMDVLSWIAKQYRLDKKEITSHKLWQGLIKKILTIMFLFSFALMFKWLELDGWTYIKWALSLLIMSEFYSITQNIYSYSTGIKIKEFDAVSAVIKFIWEQLLAVIEKTIWKKE